MNSNKGPQARKLCEEANECFLCAETYCRDLKEVSIQNGSSRETFYSDRVPVCTPCCNTVVCRSCVWMQHKTNKTCIGCKSFVHTRRKLDEVLKHEWKELMDRVEQGGGQEVVEAERKGHESAPVHIKLPKGELLQYLEKQRDRARKEQEELLEAERLRLLKEESNGKDEGEIIREQEQLLASLCRGCKGKGVCWEEKKGFDAGMSGKRVAVTCML
ncbi:unnamed protein product [Choristocarpus tenellus]